MPCVNKHGKRHTAMVAPGAEQTDALQRCRVAGRQALKLVFMGYYKTLSRDAQAGRRTEKDMVSK